MGFLVVDQSKCKKDGVCSMTCTRGLIKLQEDTGYPDMIPGGEKGCIRCGHCVAVCPHYALNHSELPVKDCPPIKPELIINEEQAVQFLRSRRSVRIYKSKPVEKEKIMRLVETARYAPTGGNGQMVEWLVLTDKSKLRTIAGMTIDCFRQDSMKKSQPLPEYLKPIFDAWDAGCDSILWDAPVLVVASVSKNFPTGMTDLCIALSYLDLLAPTMGLGTCWAGLLKFAMESSSSLKMFLGVPNDHTQFFPMMLGYPKLKFHRLPQRKSPKIKFD